MPLHSGLWHNPNFMKFWAGQTISELGSRITREGLPLAAVLGLGATPAQMGLLAAVSTAPMIIVGLFAGAWVDRLRRRPILVAADLGRALVLATIPAAALLGLLGMPHLYIVAAIAGILSLFFDVAYAAFLPSLVEREHLIEGNSKLALSGSTAEILGPGLAGVLIQALTAPVAILLDALSFVASAVSVAWIDKPETTAVPAHATPDMRREIVEGLRIAFGHPVLRALTGSAGTLGFFGAFFGTLYTLFAIRELGMTPAALGVAIAFGGVGDLLGALTAQRIVERAGLGATLIGMLVVLTAGGMFTPFAILAGGSFWLALAMLVGSQLIDDWARAVYLINEISLWQAVTPDRLLGRSNASLQLVMAVVTLAGSITAGVLGQTIGITATLVVAVLGRILATAWIVLSPVRQLRQIQSPDF